MFYLAIQTLFWIVLAVAFGIFVGRLIWKPSSQVIRMKMDALQRKISNREDKIGALRLNLDQCRATLRTYKKEMENACRPSLVPPLPNAVPSAGFFEADDLKKIPGVGPIQEGRLNALNIYTYEQLAALTPEVIAEIGDTLNTLSHHIADEGWVGQAQKILETKAQGDGGPHGTAA